MKFWLGTHMPSWLPKTDVPLFVSRRRLENLRKLPRARGEWALDSGGFTEIGDYGEWRMTEVEYVALVRRYRDEIGNLAWCAPMDWMCEPKMLKATGLDVSQHQVLTVHSFMYLRWLAPELPFIPVLQGYTIDDYRRCVDLYARCGIDLTEAELVGVGTLCRRQATSEIDALLVSLAAQGLRLHGFGVKTLGLQRYSHALASADSLAWSFRGRHVEGCSPTHKAENNCLSFALEWRERTITRSEADQQLSLAVG